MGEQSYGNEQAMFYNVPIGSAPQPLTTEPALVTNPVTSGTSPTNTVVPSNLPTYESGSVLPSNVVDWAGQVVNNPIMAFTFDDPSTPENESMLMSQRTPTIDPNAAGTVMQQPTAMNPSQFNITNPAQAQVTTAANIQAQQPSTYQAQTTQQNIQQNGQMTAAQGAVNPNALIDPNQVMIDTEAVGDGTTQVGAALQEFATQDIKEVIDTTTEEGRTRAEQLGQFGYIDSKATVKGQIDQLQKDFVDAQGNPKIPAYAQGLARGVSKIATFSGLTGTAATEAMATALMEASISVAEQDAKFFQTVTLQNLNNKQEQTLNRANVLSKMELANMDSRMAAAVQNAKSFMEMDLANLDNRQQEQVLNTQARVQSILEDSKAINASRLFEAESKNDFAKFYDELNDSINKFNATQSNQLSMFNTDQTNSVKKFNSELENNREQFYKNMQYNVDLANAKWRQDVTMSNAEMQFQAAATDVKNMLGVSVEQLNQIWDRSDSLLDYLWKSTESKQDRDMNLIVAKMQSQSALDLQNLKGKQADSQAMGGLVGTLFSEFLGSSGGQGLLSGVGSALTNFLF